MSNTKLWSISLFLLFIGWIFFQSAAALKPVLIAIVLAYLLNPLVLYIQKRFKIKKSPAIALVLLGLFIIVAIVGTLLVPPVINQATVFLKEFQSYSTNFELIIDQIKDFLVSLGMPHQVLENVDEALLQLYELVAGFLINLVSALLGYIFKAVDGLIIAVLVCYFLSSGKEMVAGAAAHAPTKLRKPIDNLLQGTHNVVWSYVKTQLIIALVIGTISTVVFMLLGIRFSFLLGIMAGILNLIPYFGSIIAGVTATLVALLTSGAKSAVFTAIAVLIIQQLEGNLLTPRLQAKTSGLHPVWIIIALLVCNEFWGTLGMFVAVPVAGLMKLLLGEAVQLIREIS